MRQIEQQLRVHDGEFRGKPEHWGYVGDVTEVLKRLQETADFLKPEKPEPAKHGKPEKDG
jgi:hypothetical protein